MPKPALTYLTRRGSVYWFRMAVPHRPRRAHRSPGDQGFATHSLACHCATTVPTPGQRNFAVDCTGPQHA